MIGSGDGDEDRGGGLRCFQRTVLRIWLLWLENHSNFLVCVFVSIEVPSLGEIQAKRAGAGGFLKGGQWGQSFRDKLSYKNYPRVSYLGPSKLYLKDLNRLSLVFLFIYFNEFSFGASAYSGFQPPTYLFFHWNCWVIGSGEQIWILTMFYFSRKRERELAGIVFLIPQADGNFQQERFVPDTWLTSLFFLRILQNDPSYAAYFPHNV